MRDPIKTALNASALNAIAAAGLALLLSACAGHGHLQANPPAYKAAQADGKLGIRHGDQEICDVAAAKVFFEVGSTAIDRDDRKSLDDLARCVQQPKARDYIIEVVGHADPRGSERSNYLLANERAKSVMRYLVDAGVPETRVRARTAGEAFATADPTYLWPYDRRADVRLLDTAAR